MIQHIVSIRLKEEFKSKAEMIKRGLEALPEKINEIKYFEVGINISVSPSAYDLVLVSEFETLSSLKAYQIHKEHVKVLEMIKLYKLDSIVVDYKK